MKLLLVPVLLFLLFLSKPIWGGATQQPLVPVSSPLVSPTSPISTSMAAFSPGIQVGIEEQHHMDTHKKMLIALVAASSALVVIILSFLFLWIYHRKFSHKSHKRSAQSSVVEKGLALAPFFSKFSSIKMVGKKGSVPLIEYKLLEKATDNFRDSNVLGEGGFGCVYKARLDDDFYAAVKKLNCENHDAEREFENEIDLLSKIQHPNIISLLGCSIHGETRFIVYELMQIGSLETQLHGPSHGSALTWHMRMKVALDTARGLEYLHEHCNPQVIHRDLKTSNILLDSDFNAKLSDFGLAVSNGAQNRNNIKLSGTLGYVAPEYLLDGSLPNLLTTTHFLSSYLSPLASVWIWFIHRQHLPNLLATTHFQSSYLSPLASGHSLGPTISSSSKIISCIPSTKLLISFMLVFDGFLCTKNYI